MGLKGDCSTTAMVTKKSGIKNASTGFNCAIVAREIDLPG
jgi:hypothetical protein